MNKNDRQTESIKIAAIQMVSGADVDANLQQAYQLIQQAAQSGAKLVALPEYFCLLSPDENAKVRIAEVPGHGPIQACLSSAAREFNVWICGGTMPMQSPEPGKVFNSCLLYAPDGSQQARYDKIHLFRFTSDREQFDEARTITAGHEAVCVETPLGRIGLSVCYDLRFPELYRSFRTADLILVPSAFTYTTGQAHWEMLLRARAVENQCYVLAPAQGGIHPHGRQTWGHTMLIDPWGEIVAQLEEGPGVVMGQFDPARLSAVRQSLPALQNRIL